MARSVGEIDARAARKGERNGEEDGESCGSQYRANGNPREEIKAPCAGIGAPVNRGSSDQSLGYALELGRGRDA